MDNNVDEQVHSIEQFLTPADDQLPWRYEHPMDVCLPSYVEHPQNSPVHPNLSPLHSSTTAKRFAVATEHLPCGSWHTPGTMGTVEVSASSNPMLWQPQWGGMNSNVIHAPVSPYETLDGPLCDWSRDFEPRCPPPSIQNIPQSLPPTLTNSYLNMAMEQYDPRLWHAWDGMVDTCASSPSPDGSTSLSVSGFLSDFAEYDFPPDSRADPQLSIAPTHNPMPPTQSAAFPYSEFPLCEPPRPDRSIECQWVTSGVLCKEPLMPNRCSVVGHLQLIHGIKPGEEKTRETCLWEHCGTVLNKESLGRHILTVHLKEKVYCVECGLLFAREDSLKRHLKGGQHKVSLDKSAARRPSRNHWVSMNT